MMRQKGVGIVGVNTDGILEEAESVNISDYWSWVDKYIQRSDERRQSSSGIIAW